MVNSLFYKEMQGIASDILREFGQGGLQYVAVKPGDGPADDPGEPTTQAVDIDGAARGVKFKYVNGSTILASDLQCVMAVHPTVTPNMDGFMLVDGVRHKVVAVQPIPPSGVIVAHRIMFRR